MPFGEFINAIPPIGFLAIHVVLFGLGAYFAWRTFATESLLGAGFALFAVADGPTHIISIGLGPPAIQLRQVKTAVRQYLHSTRTTRLPRAARVVDPNVNTMDQLLSEQHVIVAQKDHMRPHFGAAADEVGPLTNHGLAGLICRMRLTRDEKLYRTILISEDAHQSLRIVKQQVWPFIGCEPPRETQSQRPRIENLRGLLNLCSRAP